MDTKLTPVGTLLVVKPAEEFPMKGLVEAATLFLAGKRGADAYCDVRMAGSWFNFRFDYADESLGDWCHLGLVRTLHKVFGETYDGSQGNMTVGALLATAITKLCADALHKGGMAPTYAGDNCNYTCDTQTLEIRLWKSLDYCSYHGMLLRVDNQGGWELQISGCWRGSQQDPGPVYHPPEACYEAVLVGNADGIASFTANGCRPDEALKLWGVETTLLGITLDTEAA